MPQSDVNVTGCLALQPGPKVDSSFSEKMNDVIMEVYGMSTCIDECMTAL